jgi:hypothetical protein
MRRAAAFVIAAALAPCLLVAAGCMEGTTPDCKAPGVVCGPGVDGAPLEGGGDANDGALDGAAEAAPDTGGGSDGGTDAPADVRLDADAQGG